MSFGQVQMRRVAGYGLPVHKRSLLDLVPLGPDCVSGKLLNSSRCDTERSRGRVELVSVGSSSAHRVATQSGGSLLQGTGFVLQLECLLPLPLRFLRNVHTHAHVDGLPRNLEVQRSNLRRDRLDLADSPRLASGVEFGNPDKPPATIARCDGLERATWLRRLFTGHDPLFSRSGSGGSCSSSSGQQSHCNRRVRAPWYCPLLAWIAQSWLSWSYAAR